MRKIPPREEEIYKRGEIDEDKEEMPKISAEEGDFLAFEAYTCLI